MGDYKCIRVTLIVVNVIFLLIGLALLGLGIWVQVEKGDYVAIADSDTGLTGSILIIVVGGCTTLFSFLGFLGAIKKIPILLWIFLVLICLLVVVELVALILGFIYRDKVEDELKEDMTKTIKEYGTDAEGVTKAWNWVQQKFECCGVVNSSDWRFSNTEFNKQGKHNLVPDSCCIDEKDGCGNFTGRQEPDLTKIYNKGCFNELKTFVKEHLLTIGLGSLVILFIELIVIILTVVLIIRLAADSKVV